MLELAYSENDLTGSAYIYKRAAESLKSGRHTVLIIPEQAALTAEKRIIGLLGDTPSLGLEILSFNRLAETVFRKCGPLSYNYASSGVKKLVLWRTVTELMPALDRFASAATDEKLLELLLDRFSEFKYALITPAKLARAGDRLAAPEDADEKQLKLSHTLSELALIYSAYSTMLEKSCDDPCDALRICEERIRDASPFIAADFYFDSFIGFTAQQYGIIDALAVRNNVTLFLRHPGVPMSEADDSELYLYQYETEARLRKLAAERGLEFKTTLLSNAPGADKSPALKAIAEHFSLGGVGSDIADNSAVTVYSCRDIFDECDLCASLIAGEMRSGVRCRDIAVVVRDTGSYIGILESCFEDHNVPVYFSRRTDVREKPAVKFITAAFDAVSGGYSFKNMIAFLRCGFGNISFADADLIEGYIRTWKISGRAKYSADFTMNPRGYIPQNERDAEKLRRINEVRERLFATLEELEDQIKRASTVGEFTRAVYDFVCRENVAERLCERAYEMQKQGEAKLAAEESATFAVLCNAFDLLIDTLGECECDLTTFLKLLSLALSETDIGTIPASSDAVTVGDASLLRPSEVRSVYMLGASDGVFPKNISEDSLFSRTERELLAVVGLDELKQDISVESSKELFWFYRAAVMPSERLSISYVRRNTSGEEQFPSFALTRLMKLLKLSTHASDALPHELRIHDIESLSEYIPRLESAGYLRETKALLQSLPELDALYRNTREPISRADEYISKATAERIFGKTLRLSQTSAELYAKCPMSFQCKYALKLSEDAASEPSSADIGTLVHSVLRSFLDEGLGSNETLEVKINELVKRDCTLILEFTPEEKRPRIAHLLERVSSTTALAAANLMREFESSDFKPTFFELPVGISDDGILPIRLMLEDGSSVVLRGIADRVDTMLRGDKLYFRVADYKTGNREFSLDAIRLGLNMQLLIYLFSIWENADSAFMKACGAEGAQPIPAGAEYVMTSLEKKKFADTTDPEKIAEALGGSFGRSGIYLSDPEVLAAMDREQNGKFIPIKNLTKAQAGGVLADLAEFESLKRELSGILIEIGNGIKSGCAKIDPLPASKFLRAGACGYCPMKPVCKNAVNLTEDEAADE